MVEGSVLAVEWGDGIGAFVDYDTGDDAGVYIRAREGSVSLALSAFRSGDAEACFGPLEFGHVLSGLRTATRFTGINTREPEDGDVVVEAASNEGVAPRTVVMQTAFIDKEEGGHATFTISAARGVVALRLELMEDDRDMTVVMQAQQIVRLFSVLQHAASVAKFESAEGTIAAEQAKR